MIIQDAVTGDADADAERRPRALGWLGGQVLTCAGYDNAIRWRPGERLQQLFERRCDSFLQRGMDSHLAVDGDGVRLSYQQLDARANQLARFLIRNGVRPGDRIGLLSDHPSDGYVGMLAVLKANAAYVPLDTGFPPDRLAYIASDARVRMVLTRTHLLARIQSLASQTELLCLDQAQHLIRAESPDRIAMSRRRDAPDALCYIIYTSGSTGRPKGVPIGHASICNFVRVAAEVYGIRSGDRVYQGMTVAFDFSVEEIWVPWMAGATLVPKPAGRNLLGPELGAFIRDRHVTALCCVPTLLATLEADLPGLRFLLVSGESCPQDLVKRWYRPGRRFLNVYGPTEATVTATWTVLHPARPVTIGVPLPTYSVVVLDPDHDRLLPPGTMGEIGIAGIGLAFGYLNRPDLTERAFRPDFLGIPGNSSGRIYRTGDLGRLNDEGEIEHHGRIDGQVKIRGYRIELDEIESVLLRVPGIAQAVVSTYEPSPGVVELVAYYCSRRDTAGVETGLVLRALRDRLPGYMVPSYLQRLTEIPVLPSGKADRKSLPPPVGPRLQAESGSYEAPATDTERALATVLGDVLGSERVSVSSHFFNDLGASSLLMARFNALIRERTGLPPVSMKDIYLHPTVRQLAAAVAGTPGGGTRGPNGRRPADPLRLAIPRRPAPPLSGKPRYLLCGTAQLLAFAAFVLVVSLLLDTGSRWVLSARGAGELYTRLVVFGGGGLLGLGLFPVVVKWALIGRWKPRRIRVWSLAYFRFWLVKTLMTANPVARAVVGTPLYTLYLRALGARIGPGALILTPNPPVCTDMLTVGAGSVVGKDTFISGYRAWAGIIETGHVTIGAGAWAGEHSVIDIEAVLGDRAQLGHASALLAGQVVPDGQCWHGSPAEPAPPGHDYQTVPSAPCGALRRLWFCAVRLVLLVMVAGPLEAAISVLLLSHPPVLATLLGHMTLTGWAVYRDALLIGAAVVFGLTLAGLMVVGPAGRLLSRLLRPGRVYPLYGFHHSVQRAVSRLTNIRFFNALLGDSSAIVGYLRLLGYRLKPVLQTGSNFGMDVKHDVPTLSGVGSGTIVSDGLSFINAGFSATSFHVLPAVVGRRNFLGNAIAYPAGGRTGDNCLLATKVMIPIAGPVREGVGLLGSPSFEIPRSVSRDTRFSRLGDGPQQRHLLRAKNRHNAVTIALYLLVRWLYVAVLAIVALLPFDRSTALDTAGTAVTMLADLVFTVGYFVLVERAVTGFRALRPRFCSIYARPFWRHERFWKVPGTAYIQVFNGTAVKPMIWRLLGARMGRRVLDDGCTLVERSLVTVGSDCTLGAGSTIQGHSLEDGAFKSDRVVIGSRCSIGAAAFVHYGVTMGDGSVLEPDSFLMKGEYVSPGARWAGNPAVHLAAPATRPQHMPSRPLSQRSR